METVNLYIYKNLKLKVKAYKAEARDYHNKIKIQIRSKRQLNPLSAKPLSERSLFRL